MPRRARCEIVVPGLPHHVIVRGNNRRNLFSYPSCYRLFILLVRDASERFELPFHCATLMRNHVHFIVTPRDAKQLASCMRRFEQRYAQRRNAAREASGKLFEERYRSIAITSERQLAATMPYIELNPVRARIVERAEDYRWSTYRLHAGIPNAESELAALWTPHPWWTELATSHDARVAHYRDLTARRLEAHRASAAPSPPPTYSLGDERPDRSRVAEPVRDEMRTLSPEERDYGDLGPRVLSPRMAARS